MRFAQKYRLYPRKAQVQFLENQLHEACDLYNAALQERRDAWKVCRKRILLSGDGVITCHTLSSASRASSFGYRAGIDVKKITGFK